MPIDLPATATPLKEVLSDLYNTAKGPVKKKFKNYITNKNIKLIYEHLRSIGKVRTIWQTDKPTPIKSFYYPQKIKFNGKDIAVSKLSDLSQISNRIIIQGIVGQGKSIFLRYICIEELKKLSSIPVFIELRKLINDKTLIEQIRDYLKDIGLDSTEETFEYLASTNKLIILLDAYDEIDEVLESFIFNEIERLCRNYPDLIIIVTSRLDCSIQNSELFTITSITPLDASDLKPIIRKLCTDEESANKINKGVESSNASVKALLTTPLMVTLLIFVYKSDQKIPTKPIEFYESLFTTVLSKHDKQKPGGVSRVRKTNISDMLFQKIFNCISFLSSQDSNTSLKYSDLHSYIEKAKDYYGEKIDTDEYINEVCKITCLILKDGFYYSYLHKSIQEYHAANFISSLPENKVIEFYNSIIKDGKWRKWSQQLSFLVELDKYRCNKYFVLPSCVIAKKSIFNTNGVIKSSLIFSFMDEITVGINTLSNSDNLNVDTIAGLPESNLYKHSNDSYAISANIGNDFTTLFLRLMSGFLNSAKRSGLNFTNIEGTRMKHKELLNYIDKSSLFISNFSIVLMNTIDNKQRVAIEENQQQENTSDLFKF